MRKTANFGEMYPVVKLFLNNETGTPICATTDSNLAITTLVSKRTLACTVASEITLTSSDRLYLWVGVDLDVGVGTNLTKAELNVEGILNGNYDSYVLFPALVPRPSISNLSPASGTTGTSVTITGNNFGDVQDNNLLTFNGTAAMPTGWTNTQILVPVPNGATSGAVLVTRKGIQSNTLNFDVVSGTISGTITDTGSGLPIAGAVVEALQAGGVRRAARTRSTGTYSLTELNGGVYELRVSASDYATALRSAINVSAGSTTTMDVAMSKVGVISGVVTQSNGSTPITGAALKVFQGSSVVASAVSSATGAYSIQRLNPGSYTVQASAPAYQNQNQTGVIVTAQATTTVNFSLNAGTASGVIRYVYDEAGRLVSVTDGMDESAKYAHDSVGNVVSISRHSAGQASIFEITPNSGIVGTVVRITGSGFSTIPTDNVVRFNGTQATINSASSGQLVVSVPTGATTGSITITTPSGAASSSSPFVIDTNRPTIVDFNPKVGDPGSSVTITGTNFESTLNGNQVTFNASRAGVTGATSSVISTAVPAGSISGRITIDTPKGTVVSADDFFVTPKIPDFCCYSATDIEFTSRMSIGESKVITINGASKLGIVVFDAQAGQRISFNWTNVSIGNSWVRLYYPNGTIFGDYNFPSTFGVGNGSFFTTTLLSNLGQPYSTTVPLTGTYAIVVDPEGTSTGSLTLTLGLVPPDNVYSMSVGGPSKTIFLDSPGQNAQVFFTGLAGERVGLFMSNSNIAARDLSIYDPNGKLLTDMFRLTVDFNDMAPLPITGTYMIVVNALGRFTGNFTLTLYDIPPDFTAPIIAGGATVTATTTVPGQNARLTFNGTAGQRVSLKLGSGTLPQYFLSILKPDGSILISPGVGFASSGGFINPQTLPFDGVYTIVIDGFRQHIGSVPLTLYLVPSDTTGTTLINGTATTISTTTPGQNALVTFSGQASQAVTIRITNNNMGEVTVRLLKPDGTSLTSTTSSNNSFNLPSTLTVAGTYTVSIDPTGSNFGSISVNVTSP
jgi:YD repeat-containing protein